MGRFGKRQLLPESGEGRIMSDVRMEWYGDKVVGQLIAVAADGLGATAEIGVELAQQRCPVLTGWLRSNIRGEEIYRDDEEVVIALGVNAVVHYAEVQEEKHHFIRSSAEDIASLIPDGIAVAAERQSGNNIQLGLFDR